MHIIGGGVIGLSCAWYLKKAGYDVTVVDKTDMQDGCSFGNSGIIVPSHSIPLAAPGVISQGLRWMLNARSPFYIKPRLDPALIAWLWQFRKSATKAHVEKVTPIMKEFHLLSKALYDTFAAREEFRFNYEERGSVMLYRTQKGRDDEQSHAARADAIGLHVTELTPSEIGDLHPDMPCDVLGGIHYHDDAHLYPGKFILSLQEALRNEGVRFMSGTAVTGFKTSRRRITHLTTTSGEDVPTDDVLLATGSWTGKLAKSLGLGLLMQDGKGYSVTLPQFRPRPSLPVILSEARVAVTPMGDDLRIGGTLEVSNFNPKINPIRVDAILKAMRVYYPSFPEYSPGDVNIWSGYRPLSADGVPYIGRPRDYDNLIVAAGHAMLGMSLGPATGLLVSEIAQRKQTSLPLDIFDPDRFM